MHMAPITDVSHDIVNTNNVFRCITTKYLKASDHISIDIFYLKECGHKRPLNDLDQLS